MIIAVTILVVMISAVTMLVAVSCCKGFFGEGALQRMKDNNSLRKGYFLFFLLGREMGKEEIKR
jgi:hypothetical protein